jgi:hypothetical protein
MSSHGHSPTRNITTATSSKSLFRMPRMPKMSSHFLSTSFNIASSTTPKSFFKTSWRQIMCSQGYSPTWNITSTTTSKSIIYAQVVGNEFALPIDTLKHCFIDFTRHILRRPERGK